MLEQGGTSLAWPPPNPGSGTTCLRRRAVLGNRVPVPSSWATPAGQREKRVIKGHRGGQEGGQQPAAALQLYQFSGEAGRKPRKQLTRDRSKTRKKGSCRVALSQTTSTSGGASSAARSRRPARNQEGGEGMGDDCPLRRRVRPAQPRCGRAAAGNAAAGCRLRAWSCRHLHRHARLADMHTFGHKHFHARRQLRGAASERRGGLDEALRARAVSGSGVVQPELSHQQPLDGRFDACLGEVGTAG